MLEKHCIEVGFKVQNAKEAKSCIAAMRKLEKKINSNLRKERNKKAAKKK